MERQPGSYVYCDCSIRLSIVYCMSHCTRVVVIPIHVVIVIIPDNVYLPVLRWIESATYMQQQLVIILISVRLVPSECCECHNDIRSFINNINVQYDLGLKTPGFSHQVYCSSGKLNMKSSCMRTCAIQIGSWANWMQQVGGKMGIVTVTQHDA